MVLAAAAAAEQVEQPQMEVRVALVLTQVVQVPMVAQEAQEVLQVAVRREQQVQVIQALEELAVTAPSGARVPTTALEEEEAVVVVETTALLDGTVEGQVTMAPAVAVAVEQVETEPHLEQVVRAYRALLSLSTHPQTQQHQPLTLRTSPQHQQA